MAGIWDFLGIFEFLGGILNLNVGGAPVYSLYILAIFSGFWLYLGYALLRGGSGGLKRIFSGPYVYFALVVAAYFYLFGSNNDLRLSFLYESASLEAAAAAVQTGNFLDLLRQKRISGPIYYFALAYANLHLLNLVLCLFLGLFYAVWARILEESLGFGRRLALPLMALAALLQQQLHYFFSVYSIFALFFSSYFLYRLLSLVRDSGEDHSFPGLAKPVCLILLGALFRQESVVLFPVYLSGLLFMRGPALKKGLLCLFAGLLLYAPFLYHDWTKEDHQRLQYNWDQALTERIYSGPDSNWMQPNAPGAENLLVNVALNIKNGGLGPGMDKQTFIAAVREAYLTPQPALRNIWYNLKYRSAFFRYLTLFCAAVFLLALLRLRRLRAELKYLTVLSVYICLIFMIYHLASMRISIELSYNYLFPAYIAFCLVAARGCFSARGGAA